MSLQPVIRPGDPGWPASPATGSFTTDRDWLPFHPAPTRPRFVPPRGAVDAHCHVFGPGAQFPYAPERRYTPCDAPKEKLFGLRDYLSVERNVIVQATCHGADNRALVDALPLPQTDKARIFEKNARRVFPRLDALLSVRGQ